MQNVPFVDLERQHEIVLPELRSALERVVSHGGFILGEEVKSFEQAFATFTETKEAIGCANGTDALELVLLALGIGENDEVITVSNTFFATVEAIVSVGAKPVLVDVRSDNGLLDPTLLEQALTPKTRAVLPVHLYGHPVALDEILIFCEKHGLYCIEDAAQAHGASYRGKPIGGHSTAATFSFYPGKNLGALGDAGIIVTNNRELGERLRSLRDHGRQEKYSHGEFGWNMRMDGLQAAFLSVKLPHLKRWNDDRHRIASYYHKHLAGLKQLTLLPVAPEVQHSNHLFVVRHEKRDKLIEQLKARKIGTGIHYPLGCHQQPAWIKKFGKCSLPNTELFTRTCFSLPIFGGMRDEEAAAVVTALQEILS